ncbi:uncharacterized protein LTR77_009829 [Saxophila tyrrhenica]|uniref:Alpha-galactosidase n=1 Tax=Saxophila tyrrhenica TaxID=1690608 RepID=A0AAV9NY17_9PEZI|nr:hypothetical protein LTR77_009829 [Saxophila tyrrhenica]
MLQSVIALAAAVHCADSLQGPVGRLPAMGYNTFNAFAEDYDAALVTRQAKIMQERGLVDAGYNIMLLDDFYAMKERNSSGHMVADPDKFPEGIPALSNELHSMGMRLAAYGDHGYQTCGGYPGSYGHEMQDLETWYSWGMTYLKEDIPADNITQTNQVGSYERMADAIAEFACRTGVTFQLSLCNWGWQQPWIWGRRFGQSWRTNGDIKPTWYPLAAIIDTASFQYWATDFYGHNDLDILEIGNVGQGSPPGNLTHEESKSHFTAWALLKSPLLISADLSTATEETFEILGNRDLIKINQDPVVGENISPFRWGINSDYTSNATHPAEYWSGNSSYGSVFMILNTQDTPQEMFFNLTESWTIRAGRQYSVYDLWKHEDVGVAVRNMTLQLPAHGVGAFLLNDAGPEPEYLDGSCAVYYQCSFPNGTYISN